MGFVRVIDDYARENEKGFFWISALILAITMVVFVVWAIYANYDGETVRCNLPYANAIFDGVAPFTPYGDLKWEYPPLAYLLLLPPRLFTTDATMYMVLYSVEVLIFLIIGLRILMLMASRAGASQALIVLTYLVSIIILHRFIYDRFDIIVAVIALAAVYFFMTDRMFAASSLIVVGMFMKLYPALLVPVFAIMMISRRQYREVAIQAVFCMILCVALMAPFLIAAPDNAWNFISYHSDRGLQVESTFGSVLLMGNLLGLTDIEVSSSFGSWNLDGAIADSFASVTSVAMIAGLIGTFVMYLMRSRRCSESDGSMYMLLACAAVLTSFVILNKVFSAQYVIWLLMAYLPLAMYLDRDRAQRLCGFTIVTIALTILMVFLYADLLETAALGIVVLVIRNIIVLAALASMWVHMIGPRPCGA